MSQHFAQQQKQNSLSATAISYSQPTKQQALDIQKKQQHLEKIFNTIYKTRMNDVPIVNNKIKVAAIDFQLWENRYLGVMITPWFMNLMLLPGTDDHWETQQELSKHSHVFPSGRYSFITAYEAEIGKYQSCSLFSPMFDFADHNAAIDTAKAVMQELLKTENIEQNDINSEQIEGIWNGDIPHPDKIDVESEIKAKANALGVEQKKKVLEEKTLSEKLQTPISRRQMLCGKFFGEEDQS